RITMTAVDQESSMASEAEETEAAPVSVLLYSDDIATREQVRTSVGRRASIDTPRISWQDVATPAAAIDYVEKGDYDLLVLDGESAKFGGVGLCGTRRSQKSRRPAARLMRSRTQH